MTKLKRSEWLKQAVPTEAVLCDYFIAEANAVAGWTCYPETGGFDVLLVHDSGRQIGVEAKLQLNTKVAEQVLPHHSCYTTGNPGPDHRVVIVRNTTDATRYRQGGGLMRGVPAVPALNPLGSAKL
jgi:hypothetical protein